MTKPSPPWGRGLGEGEIHLPMSQSKTLWPPAPRTAKLSP